MSLKKYIFAKMKILPVNVWFTQSQGRRKNSRDRNV